MIKIYRKLNKMQIRRNVIFSSCLVTNKDINDVDSDSIYEVFKGDTDTEEHIKRLKDDKFFNDSHFKYNIIRQ